MKAIEILEHLTYVLFQDYKVWSGYKKSDFIKAMSEVELLEEQNQGLQSLLDLKQQEISVLESKVVELEETIATREKQIDSMHKCVNELEASIKAKDIIIRDKTSFIEAMAQPKTCDGCEYYDKEDLYCEELSTEVNFKWGCLSHKQKQN